MGSDLTAAIPVISIIGGLLIGAIVVLGTFIRSTMIARAREQSRREIAAYVAEGSMTAEEGERLMDAGKPVWERPKRS